MLVTVTTSCPDAVAVGGGNVAVGGGKVGGGCVAVGKGRGVAVSVGWGVFVGPGVLVARRVLVGASVGVSVGAFVRVGRAVGAAVGSAVASGCSAITSAALTAVTSGGALVGSSVASRTVLTAGSTSDSVDTRNAPRPKKTPQIRSAASGIRIRALRVRFNVNLGDVECSPLSWQQIAVYGTNGNRRLYGYSRGNWKVRRTGLRSMVAPEAYNED